MFEHARAVRPKFQEPLLNVGRDLAAAQPRPLHRAKTIRHERIGLAGVVDHDRQDERHAGGDAAGALGREIPLDAEVAFMARLGRGGNERDEQHALLDLAADLRIPFVAVLEPAIGVEPDLDHA